MNQDDDRQRISKKPKSIRELAINAVLSGRKQLEVAKIFGVSRRTLGRWLKVYRGGGIQALKPKPRGRPRGGSLQPWQSAQIAKVVVDHYPEQLRLPYYLWTREAVAQLIRRRFGIKLSVWTVGRYLARWGFTPQKPARRALEQNSQEVRLWLERKYPEIRRLAKREKAQIFWGDEMGLRSDHAAGRSYGLRGQTPVIHDTGQRFGCNMISAITNRGHLYFMVFKQRFTTEVFLEFLRRLIRQNPGKVFLIIDRHPVHRAKRVQRWVAEQAESIQLFFLPGYSPELNPDELLNQDVKTNAVGRKRAHHQDELTANVRSYLRKRQCQPHVVQKYFLEKHVRYAAA
jgi:transposase